MFIRVDPTKTTMIAALSQDCVKLSPLTKGIGLRRKVSDMLWEVKRNPYYAAAPLMIS